MGRIYVGDNKSFVWQWQPNEQIVLEGYPDGVFVHYANCNTAEAPVVQSRRVGDKLIADIPPELMQEPHDITVYVCDADGTLHSYFIPVVERPKPESYIYEPVEILRYESLAKRIAALEEGGVGGVALDTTLTQGGKAADAKATGDEIKRVAGLIPSIEGLAKEEDIPVVPTWAMQSNKPSYTASEVGADPTGTAAVAVSAHNANNEAHSDIRLEIKAIREQLAAFMDVDDETLNELSELIAAIASNQTSIAQLTTGKVSVVDIVNNLVTNASNKPLSAAMGAALAGEIDSVRSSLAGYQPKGNYLTEHQDLGHLLPRMELSAAIDTALAQAKESGEFDGPPGLQGPPGPQGPQGDPGPAGADGAPGDDYVLTDADRQEIAELAAGMVDVPSGGTKAWRKIAEFTLEEDLEASTFFYVNADNDGAALDLSESLLIANYKVTGNVGNTYYLASQKNSGNINYAVMNLIVANNATLVVHCELIGAEGAQYIRTTAKKDNGYATKVAYHGAISNPSPITGMSLQMPAGVAAGTTYEFWGVDR